MHFVLVCCITPAVTGPARSITPAVTGFTAHSIIPDVTGLVPVITPSAFITYINYVYLRRIAVKGRFRVWLQFILPLIKLCRTFLHPLQVYSGLFPPPLRHPCSRPPIRPLTEVQNWSRRNILRERVLPPRDEFTDPLKVCIPHFLLQWWLGPTPIPPSPQMPPGEPLRDPMLEAIQGPLHPRGKHPRLCSEQQHSLQH